MNQHHPYALLKSQLADPGIYIPHDQYLEVPFYQLSSFVGDDLGFSDQLGETRFTPRGHTGLMKLAANWRFIENRSLDQFTALGVLFVEHPSYKGPKFIGKSRIVTNGPGDSQLFSQYWPLRSGSTVYLKLWQHNRLGVSMKLEYAYLGVSIFEDDLLAAAGTKLQFNDEWR